jgi:hypothetical protein
MGRRPLPEMTYFTNGIAASQGWPRNKENNKMKITVPIRELPIKEERKCFRCNKKFMTDNPMMWICSDCFNELRELDEHTIARLNFADKMRKLADRYSILHKKGSIIRYDEMLSAVERLLKDMRAKRAKLREKTGAGPQ